MSGESAPAAAAPTKEEKKALEAAQRAHWVSDKEVKECMSCRTGFTVLNRKHHCRQCGGVFCDPCSVFRAECEKVPGAPSRLCLACISTIARGATAVTAEPPSSSIGPVEVGAAAGREESFEGVLIKRGDQPSAVRGAPNAKVNIVNCHVQGIEKSSNGHVHVTGSLIVGDKALQVSGNNTVVLTNCIVIGTTRAALLTANASMEATNCYFLSTAPLSVAVEGEGNAKIKLTNCVVSGADGVILHANAKLTAEAGSISCQGNPLGDFFSPHFAIAGKSEIEKTTVIGQNKPKAGVLNVIQKITGKIEPKSGGSVAQPEPTPAAAE